MSANVEGIPVCFAPRRACNKLKLNIVVLVMHQ